MASTFDVGPTSTGFQFDNVKRFVQMILRTLTTIGKVKLLLNIHVFLLQKRFLGKQRVCYSKNNENWNNNLRGRF